MKNRVVLINPRKGWRPALGLLYIASYLRQAGYEVKVIEFIDEIFFPGKNRRIWEELYEYDPDFIGLGIISWNRHVAGEIIRKVRDTTVNKVIICGGKDPTFKPEIYFNFGADFVVLGEGEETIVELLGVINSGSPLEKVKGICFVKSGQMIWAESRPPADVKNLLFPAFDLIDYKHYCNIRLGGIPGHFIRTGFIMANRGCPYRCRFCTDSIRGVYRERPMDSIINEIKWQIKNWKIEGLVFLDDLFCFDEKRAVEFCQRVINENIKLKFYAQGRVDSIGKEETINLMKQAGFFQLAIGIESGSQRMLDIMQKGTRIDQITQTIRRIDNAGIYSYAFLIVGFPEETSRDLDLTAQFLEKVKPTFVTVNYFMPMPGTKYYKDDECALGELSFSLTESRQNFRSSVPREEIIRYRKKYLSLAQRSANLNLLRYPSFYVWVVHLVFFHPEVIFKGIFLQKRKKIYTSYFEAIRSTMINYRIYGN